MEEKLYVAWKPVYEIGVPIIDEQHKKWVMLLNEFHNTVRNGSAQIFVEETLNALFDYTEYHFSEEENIFRENEFPGTDAHLAEHQEFIKTLKLLKNDFKKNNLLLSLKTMDALKDWLINHILGTDKEFGNFLLNKKP